MRNPHAWEIQEIRVTLRWPYGHLLSVGPIQNLKFADPNLVCEKCPREDGLVRVWPLPRELRQV